MATATASAGKQGRHPRGVVADGQDNVLICVAEPVVRGQVGTDLVGVDRLGQQVDPWAARSKRGVEHIRRTLNIMVRRLLDRGAVIAENASRNLFPSDEGQISNQMRFNFDDDDFRARLLLPSREEADYVSSRYFFGRGLKLRNKNLQPA